MYTLAVNHPMTTLMVLFTLSVLWCVWIQIPKRFGYYVMDGKIVHATFDGRNYIERDVRGRLFVFFFCRKHGIKLHLIWMLSVSIIELFLTLIRIPKPMKYAWDGGFAAIMVYPLSKTRRHWVLGCIRVGWFPWKRDVTIKRILKENDGHMPFPLRGILLDLEYGKEKRIPERNKSEYLIRRFL